MNQSFYTGAVGAQQQLQHLHVQGNNIANVNTYGYKAQRADFSALMHQNMRGIEEQLPAGVGTRMLMTATNFHQGGVANTERELDYMIDGEGFFALVDMASGEITFTRDGSFTKAEYLLDSGEVDEMGEPIMEKVYYLSDGNGRFVLSTEGGMIELNEDTDAELLPVGIFDYGNYDGMMRLSENRYLPIDKNGGLLIGTGRLVHGALELSNADLADELTQVIEAQRAYGLALKVVQTSDEIETTINGLR